MNSIYKLILQITGQDKGASAALKSAKKDVEGLSQSAGGAGDAFKLIGKTIAGIGLVHVATKAAEAAWELGKLGAQAERQEVALEELARQAGGSADAIVAAIKRASDGTVAETDIILAANKGILLGLGAQADQWEQLTEVARFRARAMGLTTSQALNDITTAIGRESKMIADNLGLIWDMDKIMSDYARTLGKTAGELTGAERKQALLNDTIRIGQGQIAEAGGIALDAADKFERLEASITNLKTAAGKMAAEPTSNLADELTKTVTVISGDLRPAMADMVAANAEAGDSFEDLARAAAEAKGELVFSDVLGGLAGNLFILADVLGINVGQAITKLTGDDLPALGVALGKSAAEVQELADLLGIELPLGFAAAMNSGEGMLSMLGNVQGRAYSAADGITVLGGAFQQSKPAALEFAEALYAVNNALAAVQKEAATTSVEEIGRGYEAAVGRIESSLAGLAGNVSFGDLQDIQRRYTAELDAFFREIAQAYADGVEYTDFELQYRINLIMSRFDEEVDVLKGAGRDIGRATEDVSGAYDKLRSSIEAALTPTGVTALDMGLAEAGQYIEKWDENARRLDAIAQNGFAELAAHPDWAGILGIPDNVLAMGEEALKAWASQTAAAVRDLTRPDLLNVDAAVAAVEQYFADMAAKELSLDIITKAVLEKGLISGEDAKAQVAAALGLDQTTVGETAGVQIFEGMIEKFSEKSASSEFAGYLQEDVTKNAIVLKNSGRDLWIATEVGILEAMEEGQYVAMWVSILLPSLLAALGTQGQWTGEGEP